MTIQWMSFNWKRILQNREKTDYFVLHHRAGDGNLDSIHTQHISQGYSGIGYHFYIRKNGEIFSGRPLNKVGAHCLDHNDVSIGICFEGNFEIEKPTPEQIKSGQELIKYLWGIYPNAKVVRHKDLNATACPGKNFDINLFKGDATMTVDEAIKILTDKCGLEKQTIGFMLCYKYGEELVKKLAKAMV